MEWAKISFYVMDFFRVLNDCRLFYDFWEKEAINVEQFKVWTGFKGLVTLC